MLTRREHSNHGAFEGWNGRERRTESLSSGALVPEHPKTQCAAHEKPRMGTKSKRVYVREYINYGRTLCIETGPHCVSLQSRERAWNSQLPEIDLRNGPVSLLGKLTVPKLKGRRDAEISV